MSKMKAPRVFVPLYKVDEEQRLVYGRITAEELDKSGEVMDYTASKPNFEKWSNDIHEASGGLSKGNVRVMHGLSVAGKLTELDFNDDDQSIEVCAKIVDEGEWNKVVEGCYTGFSVGGKYGKKWNETIDGAMVKYFEAIPNEVSIVDNPCVKSATFSMIKADGTEEQLDFLNPGDQVQAAVEEPAAEDKSLVEQQIEKAAATTAAIEPAPFTNQEVAAKAEELQKAAGTGDWMDFIPAAREELTKLFGKDDGDAEDKKDGGADEDSEDAKAAADKKKKKPAADDKAAKADHTIADRLTQKWTCTDGQAFDKKADAEEHEAKLAKATDMSEADKLAARLAKAVSGEVEAEPGLMDDWDRLGKAVQVIEEVTTVGFEPDVLAKGMYTVSRFANTLWDLGSLCRKIAKESVGEGDDASDKTVSDEIKKAMSSLGDTFKVYVDNQITELLAGIDDDVCVEVYDYYYRAAQENGEDQLAKDVCSLIDDRREPAAERRDDLVKAFGLVVGTVEVTDELSPPMQKRFDDQAAQIESLTKVANDAVTAVEELKKSVKEMEDTPLPRAPIVAHLPGDNFMGKKAETREEKVAILQDLLKTHGPDELATMMIKAAHSHGGQPLHLNQRG